MAVLRAKPKARIPRRGWGIVEAAISVLVGAILAIPLLYTLTGTRSDTTQAINYLRAMEIANEAIAWTTATPMTPKSEVALEQNSGSLVKAGGARLEPMPYRQGRNATWASNSQTLTYPDQYGRVYFHRTIDVQALQPAATDHRQFLSRVTVTVAWNERVPPAKIDTPDREKKVVMTALVCDEMRGY